MGRSKRAASVLDVGSGERGRPLGAAAKDSHLRAPRVRALERGESASRVRTHVFRGATRPPMQGIRMSPGARKHVFANTQSVPQLYVYSRVIDNIKMIHDYAHGETITSTNCAGAAGALGTGYRGRSAQVRALSAEDHHLRGLKTMSPTSSIGWTTAMTRPSPARTTSQCDLDSEEDRESDEDED